MCFPTIEGAVEVEERRPRYPNESRRKRLKFVKDRSTRPSDEWGFTRPPTAEKLYQHEFQRPIQYPQWTGPQQQQPPQFSGVPPQPPHMPPQGHFHSRLQHHNSYSNDDEHIEEFNPSNQIRPQRIEPRDHNVEPYYHQIEPRYHEPPPRSQLPRHLQVNLAQGRSGRGRSRNRSRSRGPPGQYQDHSVYSDDTIDESNRGSHRSRRRHSRRPRSLVSTDSYDSFDVPPRQHRRSGSGRRPYV